MRGKWFLSAAAIWAAIGFVGAASAQQAGDPAGDRTSNARINPGQTVQGSISSANDKDWYRMSVRTGQVYRVSLNGGDGDGVLGDPTLRIVSADGTELAANDDANNSLNSYVEYVPTRGGDVYVEAAGFGEGTGTYTLALEAARLPPDPATGDLNTRARLTFGQATTGAIDFTGDKDWYRVRLEAGHSYRFGLAGSGDHAIADPLMRILGPDGEEMAVDDDGGDGLNSYTEFTAAVTGNYFVEAKSFDETATGSYTLTASQGDIPGDNSTDAVLAADGDYREGTLTPGDHDWYRVDLKSGQSIRVALNGGDGSGQLGDPLLVLHGPDGAEIAQDDDSGEGLGSWIEYTATADGTYYLDARAFSEEADGKYSLTLTGGEIPGAADGAETLTTGEGRISFIGVNGDADWFRVDMIEGRPYRFTLEGTEPDPLADPVLTIFDEEGKPVATDDDGGQGANAYVTFIAPKSASYYASVSSFGDTGTGRYSLRVTDTDVPGNAGSDETLGADDDERASSIDFAGDLDWYGVQLEAGVRYEITVSGDGEHPLVDPYLEVMNSQGAKVAEDDDAGPGNDARLIFTPQMSDGFYLQASGVGGSTGGYKIAIKRLTTTAPSRR